MRCTPRAETRRRGRRGGAASRASRYDGQPKTHRRVRRPIFEESPRIVRIASSRPCHFYKTRAPGTAMEDSTRPGRSKTTLAPLALLTLAVTAWLWPIGLGG